MFAPWVKIVLSTWCFRISHGRGVPPQNAKDEEVIAAMKEAVQSLQVQKSEDPVETVLNALEDTTGAQDPTFNTNSSHVAVSEDQVLAALEDGIGAQEPLNSSAVRAGTPNISKETANHSSPAVQTRAMTPEEAKSFAEHVLPTARGVVSRSFWSTRSGALSAAVGFVAATWLAVICLATGFWMAVFSGWRGGSKGSLRSTIEASQQGKRSKWLSADEATLEFQEAALLVGASVTVVGELHRGVDGQLSLRPWQGDSARWRAKKLREPWRTSWERGDEKGRSAPDILKQKVFISDDEQLLSTKDPEVEGKLRECASGLGNLLG
eukprot:g2272.t1